MWVISYVKSRLGEASTWGAIGAGMTAAAAVPDERIKWLVVACAVVGALVPEKSV